MREREGERILRDYHDRLKIVSEILSLKLTWRNL
jgi:hypothetical protein